MTRKLGSLTTVCPHCRAEFSVDMSEGDVLLCRGRYALDLAKRRIFRDGQPLTRPCPSGLTLKVMALFWEQRRRLLTSDTIYDALYGARPYVDQPEPRIVKVFIARIRKWLRKDTSGFMIETCYGHGYRLVWPADVEVRTHHADEQRNPAGLHDHRNRHRRVHHAADTHVSVDHGSAGQAD